MNREMVRSDLGDRDMPCYRCTDGSIVVMAGKAWEKIAGVFVEAIR
jgi:hypothetical protein